MELVEAFCAEHKVTYEEVLYDWPASRFEALYSAFTKRQISNELRDRKHLEMAALWSNPNLDSEKDPNLRSNVLSIVESNYNKAISMLYSDNENIDEVEIDEDDPFFKAAKRGKEKYKLPDGHDIDQIE